jgi:hypothetical protein
MPVVVGCALRAQSARVGQAVMDQVAHEVVHGAVVREPALVARLDEAHASQPRQLMTRHGQRQVQCAREVSHRQFVMRERVHQGKADRVRKDLEDFHRIAQHVHGGETVSGCRHEMVSSNVEV